MIEVVAGIIYKNNKFLIAQRNLKKSQGGFWEFPGGKVEAGETCEEALKREIKEEFDADIEVKEYVGENIHHYPEKDIKLIFYKAELISAIVSETGLSKKDTEATINSFVNVVSNELAKKEKVQLIGFGTFETRERAARTGRNPQTGKELKIAASTTPAFKAGKALKDIVNK